MLYINLYCTDLFSVCLTCLYYECFTRGDKTRYSTFPYLKSTRICQSSQMFEELFSTVAIFSPRIPENYVKSDTFGHFMID